MPGSQTPPAPRPADTLPHGDSHDQHRLPRDMKIVRSGARGGLLLGAALLALLGAGWACLITNCPRGGKRSGSAVAVPGAVLGRSREVRVAVRISDFGNESTSACSAFNGE